MDQEKREYLEINVQNAKFNSVSKKGWKKWTVLDVSGKEHTVAIGPSEEYEIKPDDVLTVFKGAYSWVLDKDTPGVKSTFNKDGGSGSSGGNNNNGGGSYKKDNDSKDKYWQEKADRDVEWTAYQKERDNKIEFQSYFRLTLDAYIAALPHLNKQPQSTIEIDDFIDDAFAKAQALVTRRNKN